MEVTTLIRTVGLDLLKPALPQRQLDGHKGTFGKLLIVGGAVGYTGAPYLTASAAVRSGCGLVFLGVPESIWPVAAVCCWGAFTHFTGGCPVCCWQRPAGGPRSSTAGDVCSTWGRWGRGWPRRDGCWR